MPELRSDTRHHVRRSSSEQDRAAGGREARLITVGEGAFARASVELKRYVENGTCWAYLRWSAGGKTLTRYLGRTQGKSRFKCLSNAWELARSKGYSGTIAKLDTDGNLTDELSEAGPSRR